MNDYEKFVDKFKPKLTTDDCYTPPLVYDAIRDWAINEYSLDGREIVRPFYPNGDYQHFDYSPDCVVIDNPPFSILAEIKRFYMENNIAYFLFAPHLTLFSTPNASAICYIVTDTDITYENGARVNTDFVTSLDEHLVRTAPTLRRAILTADKENRRAATKKLPKYAYPDEVISSARLGKITNVDFALNRSECSFTRALESQRKAGKAIFGGGFLISELRAAEHVDVWELSERERNIIGGLR